jgi:hypothetical protein
MMVSGRHFRAERGFDPLELFGPGRDAASTAAFLKFRRDLAACHGRGVARDVGIRAKQEARSGSRAELRPTTASIRIFRMPSVRIRHAPAAGEAQHHVPDRGAGHGLASWGAEILRRATSQALTTRREGLAIDLNIVEDTRMFSPPRSTLGTELFQMVYQGAANFGQVVL